MNRNTMTSGDGRFFPTPSKFVREVLREKKEPLETTQIRSAILEGYQAAIRGLTVRDQRSLRELIE